MTLKHTHRGGLQMSTDITTANTSHPCGPRLDEAAPDFTARTTKGVKSLSDYRGQWL